MDKLAVILVGVFVAMTGRYISLYNNAAITEHTCWLNNNIHPSSIIDYNGHH